MKLTAPLDLCDHLRLSRTVGCMKVGLDQRVLDCNDAAANIFQLDILALKSKRIVDVTAIDDKLNTYQRFEEIARGEMTHSRTVKRYLTATGQEVPVSLEFWTIFDETGTSPLFLESILYAVPSSGGQNNGAVIAELQGRLERMEQLALALVQQGPQKENTSINLGIHGNQTQTNIGDNRGQTNQ